MDNFSNLMIVGECLLDKKRTTLFKKAIEKVVKKGDVVLDAGTGSGIMAMFAANAGAKKVYAIEIDPSIAKIARGNAKKNNLSKKIKVINSDVTKLKFSHIDVLIIEMMDTGLIAEQQAIAINNLLDSEIITEETTLIPHRYKTFIEFVKYDFNFYEYGFEMPMVVQARNFGSNSHIKEKLSKKIVVSDHNFNEKIKLRVNKTPSFKPTLSDTTNAIRLSAKTYLTHKIATFGTSDMNMPVIIPIPKKKLKKGRETKFNIKYSLGKGFHTVKVNFS